MPQYDSPAALRMRTLPVRGKEAVSPGALGVHRHPLGGEGRLARAGVRGTFRFLMVRANSKVLKDGKEPVKEFRKSGREGRQFRK